ncbi:hypothetical protein Tco_0689376 [Tanacetum coccineum]
MVPRTVLTRSGPISVNTVRPVNTVQSRTTVNNAGPMKNVNTGVKGTKVNTARPTSPVLRAIINQDLRDKEVIEHMDATWHMTGKISYLQIMKWGGNDEGLVPLSLGSDIHVYKIIRADGNTSYHKTFSSMLRKFDRQDLVDLHKLVMKKFEDSTPEGYNLLLWGDLKIMFEPNAEDAIWSNQQDWTLISWKLYDNCGVHSLLMDGTLTCFNMLVEKRYPLIKEMLEKMLNWKLEAETESTMAFKLLKFIKSQMED